MAGRSQRKDQELDLLVTVLRGSRGQPEQESGRGLVSPSTGQVQGGGSRSVLWSRGVRRSGMSGNTYLDITPGSLLLQQLHQGGVAPSVGK